MVINEIFEWTVGGASNMIASMFFRFVQHKIEISYGKPGTNKILTSNSKRVPKSNFVLLSRGPYIQERIQWELGGSKKHQDEMFLLEMKLSSSTPTLHAITRPPQVPIGAT
jgi:hypothetical protein